MDVQDLFDTLDVHGFEDVEEAEKVKVLNDVVWEITTDSPWDFMDTFENIDAATDVNASTGLVTLETPWSAVRYVRNSVNPERGVRWVREDDLVDGAIDFAEQDTPVCFYFVGQQLYLWPIPTGGTYRIGLVQAQEELNADSLEADILIPARHHRVILLGMLYKLHSQEDDAENAQMFKSQYDEKLVRMRNDLFKMQYDRSDSMRVYGWDDDDGDA